MKAVDDLNVYDFKREGDVDDCESCLEPSSGAKNGTHISGSEYHLECEELIEKNCNDYILNIAGFFSDSDTKVACSLSNYYSVVYSLQGDRLNKISSFLAHSDSVTNIRFARDKGTHLFTSSLDCTVKLWDLRNKTELAQTYLDNESKRPISCFDISCDGRFICAGTELISGSSFLLFWDIRSTKLLGGYWESHVDDLTQVKFHPENRSRVITGGMDGLINEFDIIKNEEENALLNSLNTEQSVEKMDWLSNDSIYCLTHGGDVQFWNVSDSSISFQHTRQQLAKALSIKHADNLYNISVHKDSRGNNVLLAGSNFGSGDCLRSVVLDKSLSSAKSFFNNKQVVRDSVYNEEQDILITGGEKGIINVWKAANKNSSKNNVSSNKLKGIVEKKKSSRLKPY